MQVHERPLSRSCACVGLSRAAWYAPPSDWAVRDAGLIVALARLVEERPSRGFWKCSGQLRKTRADWNPKRIYRVYKAMKLNLRRSAKRRLPKRERVSLYVPKLPDTVWSIDFMSDAPACGRRFRTFNVVDDFNREALHIEIDTSINSNRLVRIFEQLKRDHGLPQVMRSDNGPEFLGEAFTQWAKANGVAIQYIQPGRSLIMLAGSCHCGAGSLPGGCGDQRADHLRLFTVPALGRKRTCQWRSRRADALSRSLAPAYIDEGTCRV